MELFVPFVSAAVALTLIAVGFLVGCLVGRLGRGRASHVVFLPADRPIPVSSGHWQRVAEEADEVLEEPPVRTLSARIVRVVFKVLVVALAVIGIAALATC